MKQKILVVDDEKAICDLLKISFEGEGFEVQTSYDGYDALEKINDFNPDLLVLDLMLPGIGGLDICKKVTGERAIPIIMLTAKSDLIDKVIGLELGADDYITKPFHTRELIARVKALLRRVSSNSRYGDSNHLSNGPLELFHDRRKVVLENIELELSAKEYDLLYFFLNNIDQVFTREALLDRVWGYDFPGDTRTVDVHIQRLRKKLKEANAKEELIQTVFGVGYKMAAARPGVR